LDRAEQDLHDLRSELANAIQVLNSSMRELAHAQTQSQLVSFKTLLSTLLLQFKLLMNGQRAALRLTHTRLLNDIDAVAESNLFDPAWYLKQRPDVAASGLNPLSHYVQHGATERCHPGPRFDAIWYLDRYPDVAAAGTNPLVHYVCFGKAEGREIRPLVPVATTAASIPSAEGAPEGNDNEVPAAEMLRRVELIRSSPLFDPAWYQKRYPDVASSGLDPAVHYLTLGARENRHPGPDFDAEQYLKMYPDVAAEGSNPLVHYLEFGWNESRFPQPVEDKPAVDTLIRDQFASSMPIPTFSVPRQPVRITVLTDSIASENLDGGISTALILVALLAKRLNADLRIVTRRDAPGPAIFAHILSVNGIESTKDVEFLHSPLTGERPVSVSDNDIFVTTSWWTTQAVRTMVDPARIFYLLHEDERMLYPFSDQRLRCEEVLADTAIRFLINSELLFEHFTTGPDAHANIAGRGYWFEPAFPSANYYPEQALTASGKRQFFFYARPTKVKNLYWRGLEAIAYALERGILRPQDWEFNFVGGGLEPLRLPGKPVINFRQSLQTTEYAALVRQIDLSLSLMYSPHPGYPPLDLAASGAVVVTNTTGIKTNLAQYSENIICADTSVDGLLAALAAATRLVHDPETRQANFQRGRLLRDWHVALEPVLRRVSEIVQAEIR
jgi:hypothetical protein